MAGYIFIVFHASEFNLLIQKPYLYFVCIVDMVLFLVYHTALYYKKIDSTLFFQLFRSMFQIDHNVSCSKPKMYSLNYFRFRFAVVYWFCTFARYVVLFLTSNLIILYLNNFCNIVYRFDLFTCLFISIHFNFF